MAWEDFVLQFTDLSINHLINTSLFSFSKTWREVSIEGRWARPDRAGGCLNHPATFLSNPQYCFTIPGKEEEEVVLQLSQREEQDLTRVEREKLVIGFHLVAVEANREYRLHQRVQEADSGTSDYIRYAPIFTLATLSPALQVPACLPPPLPASRPLHHPPHNLLARPGGQLPPPPLLFRSLLDLPPAPPLPSHALPALLWPCLPPLPRHPGHHRRGRGAGKTGPYWKYVIPGHQVQLCFPVFTMAFACKAKPWSSSHPTH